MEEPLEIVVVDDELIVRKRLKPALEKNGYNRTQTARELGISRNTLWRKIKKHKISEERPEAAIS